MLCLRKDMPTCFSELSPTEANLHSAWERQFLLYANFGDWFDPEWPRDQITGSSEILNTLLVLYFPNSSKEEAKLITT